VKVKCQHCSERSDKNTMIVVEVRETSRGVRRKYCHKRCEAAYRAKQEFLNKEKKEFGELISVIKKIHGIEIVPQQFFPYLQRLRNGTVHIRNTERKYKEGFDYKLISQTYIYVQKQIDDAKRRIQFESTLNELKYCLAIVQDKIHHVKRMKEKWQRQKVLEKAQQEMRDTTTLYHEREYQYHKRESGKDISNFL